MLELSSSGFTSVKGDDVEEVAASVSIGINEEVVGKVEEHALEPVPVNRSRSATFSPLTPDNAPTILTWKNLVVSTKTATPKVLLNNVSGSITGGFWAVMSPSGGGKTTLLSALSLRLDTSKMNVSGVVHLNGQNYNKGNLKAMSAYVLQDDLLYAELTVEETIFYAARLRLSDTVKDAEEMKDIVDEVIFLMGIDHVRNVIIGDSRRKGISGGERKRVCVAIELLSRPKLIFLDEPTSGLDSSTALSVITSLRALSARGICTVVCTIHQPQKKIFELFDNLILMKKGTIVYQGSSSKSITFLETLGFRCPEGANPADFLLDSITSKDEVCIEKIDFNAKKEIRVNLELGANLGLSSKQFTFNAWFWQFVILFQRSGKQYIRQRDIIVMNFSVTILIAFFICMGIWRQLGTGQDSVPARIPSLFFACVTQGIIASLQCISSFPQERAIILRERAAGSYYVSAYFAAKTCVDMLSVSWGPILFSIIVYFVIGYQPVAYKFFTYLCFMLLDTWAALSLATMVSCICVSVEMSTVVLSVCLEVTRLYGGFFTSPMQLDEHHQWAFADAISYLKYAFMGVAVNELTGLDLTCTTAEINSNTCKYTTGEQIMDEKGYNRYTVPFCAGMLVVYICICRLISYLALKYITY